jgi:hypothetical protein
MTSLIFCAHYGFRESEIIYIIREGLLFLTFAVASITRLNSSVPQLDFTMHQGLHYVLKDSNPKELGQVISVAKQPKPAVQSNGFEVVD